MITKFLKNDYDSSIYTFTRFNFTLLQMSLFSLCLKTAQS